MEWDANARTINITGADHYKTDATAVEKLDGVLFAQRQVAQFWAMHYDKFENNEKKCVYAPCESFCSDLYYQYSNGCGQDANPWVAKKGSLVQTLTKKSALQERFLSSGIEALNAYVIVSQGQCELCEECDPGQYNPGCNKWKVGVEPKGWCKTCLDVCGEGRFLWHANGLRGCAPAEGSFTGNGTVRVLTDYECKVCPTWIRRNGGMYAVLGCGNKATFEYFRPDTEKDWINGDFTKAQVEAKIKTDSEIVARQDVDWKFKPFVYPVDYCPDNYYFDATKSGCNFETLPYVLELGQAIEHGVDPYKRDCCVVCDDCIPGKEKKVINKWKECDGSTLSDTQKPHCVSQCQSGYFENSKTRDGGEGECTPCTRCKNP
jgi:hypothetical protein